MVQIETFVFAKLCPILCLLFPLEGCTLNQLLASKSEWLECLPWISCILARFATRWIGSTGTFTNQERFSS